jgi:hypothetical protein
MLTLRHTNCVRVRRWGIGEGESDFGTGTFYILYGVSAAVTPGVSLQYGIGRAKKSTSIRAKTLVSCRRPFEQLASFIIDGCTV